MAEVKIKGQLYQVTSDGAFDYASNSGSICYFCSKGTKQWLPYQHPPQTGSSGSNTIPIQYSNRLAADVYDDNIGDVQIRWGPAAQTWLQNETLSKGVSIATVKALTEHFTYVLAARIGSPRAIIKSPPKNFSADNLVDTIADDCEHISVELSGKRKADIHITGKGFGATAYDNMRMSKESIMYKNKTGYSLDTELSTGSYSLAGVADSQA